jgi:hypothetical protein
LVTLTINQFQTGGYGLKSNIVKRKRRLPTDETSMEKKRKLEEDFNIDWLFNEARWSMWNTQ